MLDYDQWIALDAESLAETGIAEAYGDLTPHLVGLGISPDPIEEITNSDLPSYAVRHKDTVYQVYGPDMPEEHHAWGRATYVLFAIVNSQLQESEVRFYATHGGNDLGGFFLRPEMAEKARGMSNKRDWPYVPDLENPWYGQPH